MENPTSKRVLNYYYTAVLILCFIDILIYLSVKSIWFFVNKTINDAIGSNLPWAWFIFALFSVVLIYLLTILISRSGRQKRYSKRPKLINIILPGVLVFVLTSADVVLYLMLGDSKGIVGRSLAGMLPCLLFIFLAIFFIIIYPNLYISNSILFKVSSVVIAVLLIVIYFNGYGKVKITSGPFIQYVDDSNIAVMWTTNKNSTSYIEYGPDKNNLKRIEPVENGIAAANTKIHKVVIPVENSSSLVYRVASTKINNYYQNIVEYGNTALSDFKSFKNNRGNDNVTFYILNDIHENKNIYSRFLSDGDYDFIVLGGDAINSVDSDKIIINEILKPLGTYTNGEKPVYFVRGNHETRGAAQSKIMEYFSLPGSSFFYDFKFGPIHALVLDSGEDKLDSHEEYSGLAHFNEYRNEETKWLSEISKKVNEDKNALYKIAFVHIPLNTYIDSSDGSYLKEYEENWIKILNDMRINTAFSGHTHSPKVVNSNNKFSFPIFIGGGEYNAEKDYSALKVSVSKAGMKIQYITYDGRITNEYEVPPLTSTAQQ